MNQPEVAPYGGFIVKSLEDEKANEAKIEELSIEVDYNGTVQKIRPEAFKLNGVDNLSTEEIKSYIDYYLNYTVTQDEENGELKYNQIPFDDQITFRVEWIDDSNVVIVFKTNQDQINALRQIRRIATTLDENDPNFINEVIQEVDAKDYNPIIQFRKSQSLSNRLGLPEKDPNEVTSIEEDETSIELKIRQAFQSDRKVKNASQYSRYYLVHGEPERDLHPRRHKHHHRRSRRDGESIEIKANEPEEEDLFADKLKGNNGRKTEIRNGDDEEEDLFANKLKKTRSRSPTRNNDNGRYRQRY
ncbi:uncharacterized protein KGF55_002194 [Candida pseudojiufengensis]|uniref:uncharacterized protein n=1 Tax=Candida pseudojiufengensis TaxID=497109 RepID=UPI0022244633|nr:uncharacterized protein KGF55_002194 [Candida pseudojiufengensis]KAI5964252.1 hypothetical protein KGF55_002194 [Candida pseudojiufengensis]